MLYDQRKKKSMKLIIICTAFVFISLFSFSQDYIKYGIDNKLDIPKGLSIGDIAPDFTGTNQNGEIISLSESLRKGKVVLIFYRGYWCPICNRYLNQYQDSLDLIVSKGAQIIAVTPEQEEGLKITIDKIKPGFDIISDKNNKIQKKYDVLFKVTENYTLMIENKLLVNIPRNNGMDEAFLPVPATFVIGKDGKIEYVQFDPNYKNRATVNSILSNI